MKSGNRFSTFVRVDDTECAPRSLRLGDPVAFLPVLHFALLKFSKHVALAIVTTGVQVLGCICRSAKQLWLTNGELQLVGKTDQRFVEHTFKLARDQFHIRTVLTPSQFLEQAGHG